MEKKSVFSRIQAFSFSFKKSIALMLIFIMLLSQTIRFDVFFVANAKSEQYRDIVSILVDEVTEQQLRGQIRQYAENIQKRLGSTRVIISVVKNTTTPAMIAAQNEKWYYEGDGDDGVKSQLVGTILIGNVPIPMVTARGKNFPSIFPYVDFENKVFVYNEASDRFEKNTNIGAKEAVEIWHGVINPALGREWQGNEDILKISKFLEKTTDFYSTEGKTGNVPRVFYFDGFAEKKAMDERRYMQYGQKITNAENLSYQRFTKYFLKDLNTFFKEYDDAKNENADVKLGGSNIFGENEIATLPDIQTRPIIENLLKDFVEIFNKKVLGEELAAVHNAGRYNEAGGVRADLVPVLATVSDDLAVEYVRAANDVLQKGAVDFFTENRVARKVPIVDSIKARYGNSPTVIPYANYFFGQEGKTINDANQCSIARGEEYDQDKEMKTGMGRSILVEANVAFDGTSTQEHVSALGQEARCYPDAIPKIQTFWGGNSLLRIANQSINENPLTMFPEKKFTGFTKSIFSLGGMLASDRVKTPSLAQCMDYTYQYTLKQPHVLPPTETDDDRFSWMRRQESRFYPEETDGTYFTCISKLDEINEKRTVRGRITDGASVQNDVPIRPGDFFTEARWYKEGKECLVGKMTVDGKTLGASRESCITQPVFLSRAEREEGAGGSVTDTTNYRDLEYHTIDGILLKTSPTDEEIKAAEEVAVTPNLAVNQIRSMEFVTKKGNIVTLEFPNFFQMKDDISSVGGAREWLKKISQEQWQKIKQLEDTTEQSDFDEQIAREFLNATDLPERFDWNDYISDETLNNMIIGFRWLHPNSANKARDVVLNSLSWWDPAAKEDNARILSGYFTPPSIAPYVPLKNGEIYEIAYLGLTKLFPEKESSTQNNDIFTSVQNDFSEKSSLIQALNITEEDNSAKMSDITSAINTQCGPPDGVSLFKWPSAIKCWIKSQFPPKILAGRCGGNTIGFDYTAEKSTQNLPNSDVTAQKIALEKARVIPHFSQKYISHYSQMEFSASLQTDESRIASPQNSFWRLEILSLTSGGKTIEPQNYDDYFSYNSANIPLDGSESPRFVIAAKNKNFTLTARVVYDIRLLDGTIEKKFSENFVIESAPEFLDAKIFNKNNENVSVIEADADGDFSLNIVQKKSLDDAGENAGDVTATIFDDISNEKIGEFAGKNGTIVLDANIAKKVGVYRVILSAKNGVAGEFTFSVMPGKITEAVLVPTSTMTLKNATTIVTLSLRDKMGNSVTPDMYDVELSAENAVLLDASGNAKKSLSMSIFDSNLSFMIRAENVGNAKIFAKVKSTSATGKVELSAEKTISVVEGARVNVKFENEGKSLTVDDASVPLRVQIRDLEGNLLSGFSSIATLALPNGAGKFSKEVIEIKNGQSENFSYIPWTVAGDYALTVDVPGIGTMTDAQLSLSAGKGMTISHTETNDGVTLMIRDRYGNVTNFSGEGMLTALFNPMTMTIAFDNGQAKIPKAIGEKYIVEVPALEQNSLSYEEEGKTYTIQAASKYAFEVAKSRTPEGEAQSSSGFYEYFTDYNARYTVLAGGSFMRDAENILFRVPKNASTASKSLAASTLLSSPFADETIVSLFPNGGYSLGQVDDMVLETSLDIFDKKPVIQVMDRVKKSEITKILYTFDSAQLRMCRENENCNQQNGTSEILAKMLLDETSGYSASVQNQKIVVSEQGKTIFSIDNTGSIEKQPSVSLSLVDYNTMDGLVFEVTNNGAVIAQIRLVYSGKNAVELISKISVASASGKAPQMQNSEMMVQGFSDKIFGSNIRGASVKRSLSYDLYDMDKLGPAGIDDIGTLDENPGIGWMGNNRMMLSYAAGDTVGEATKWFHTYMFVNMGDPVASVYHGEPDTQIDGLDKSIGTQIADGRKSQIHDFFQKDMNADGLTDILVQYSDGFMELLLNVQGKFRSAGNIAFLPRLRDSLVKVADFQGDKFADIISLDDTGELRLIANDARRFTEYSVSLTNNTEAPRNIQQMKIFDMDKDGKDDIVYLTSVGQLGILYGTENVGKFDQKILDDTLGISLKDADDNRSGAIKTNFVAQIPQIIGEDTTPPPENPNQDTPLSDAYIRAQVYYQEGASESVKTAQAPLDETAVEKMLSSFGDFSEEKLAEISTDNTRRTIPIPLDTYIRSQYASLIGMEAVRKFSTKNQTLYPKDTISVEISLKNNNAQTAENVKYLEKIPEIFGRDDTIKYSVEVGGAVQEKDFLARSSGDYGLEFDVGNIAPGETAKIRYTLRVLSLSYGEMLVGNFDESDPRGDVSFRTSTTCGAETMHWYSSGVREYASSRTPARTVSANLPEGISEKISEVKSAQNDSDNNGIPDYIDKKTDEERRNEIRQISWWNKPKLITLDKDGKGKYSVNFDEKTSQKIINRTQEIVNGLACGFGGGSCMSFPINWAPLAPGNDPVIFGTPVGDGFKVNEGVPIFSALTGVNISIPGGCVQAPVAFPASPLAFNGACTSQTGAGGYLGSAKTNFVRTFVTPTLTLGMGAAVCLGAPADLVGNAPGKWLFPLVQGWNCIVMAKAMPLCKSDGSVADGDVTQISGLANITSSANGESGNGSSNQVWNGKSCNFSVAPTQTLRNEEKALESEILSYMRSPTTEKKNIAGISAKIARRNISSLNTGPMINIGRGGADIEVFATGKDKFSEIDTVVNVKNKRISAFPDFIMNWLTRQTEELTNSLFTPPNLTIIPPTNFGQNAKVDSTYSDFLDKLSQAYSKESFDSLRAEMSTAYQNTEVSTKNALSGGSSWLGQKYQNTASEMLSKITPTLNAGEGGLNSIRAAYNFVGKLPFINIRQTRVNVNVPWILPSELNQYERKLKSYQNQINSALKNWCATGESAECLQNKAKLSSSGFASSIQANLKRIEEYRRFPEKLQKYVTWKDRLLYDLLCNIEAVEKMTFGWIRDNGIRFQKWAELYVLIKAIAESWQPLLDIFANTNAQCGVCRNERYNAQKWKFKLISAIIPQIPVISFPKWPDVVLDLSDVRLGIDIAVPDFNFRISPIRLPNLPDFSLPNSPNFATSLPTLPVLPALPNLPDLPKLPSLPMVKLPDLPPPPKLPKISGSIRASLNILKLIAKLYCFYQKTALVPEWQVGDVIAQRTERQGTLPMDFLDVQFPQFSIPTIKEIRVATHLNYILRTEFLTEFAKKAVKPINEFTTDLSNKMPSNIQFLEKGADTLENGANDAANVIKDTVKEAENATNSLRNDIQEQSNSLNNASRQIENNLQKSSDAIENKAQDAVNEFLNATSFDDSGAIKNLLSPIIAELEAEKDIFYTTDEFFAYFTSELRKAGMITFANDVERKMIAARKNAEKEQEDILQYNERKFTLLRDFINEQKRKTGEMQNVVDLLRSDDSELLASSPYTVGFLASETRENPSLALSGLEKLEKEFVESFSEKNSKIETVTAYDIGKSLQGRINRIAQMTTTEQSTMNATSGGDFLNFGNEYLPKFDAMYVLTEKSRTQTQLFAYTELIRPTDRVDVLDIDNDGDRDFVFVLGGKLYVKNTHLNEPQKIIDTTVTTVQNSEKLPEVANNFTQIMSSPSELNVSFRNTVSGESEWRMEFYDSYLEWDRMSVNKNEYDRTPRTTVDLLLNSDFSEFENGIRSKPVKRYILNGEKSPNFLLEWPKIDKISWDIFISISPNRVIYTGNKPVVALYRTSGDDTAKTMRLQPHTAYQFDTTVEMRATWGDIFVINGSSTSYKYSASDMLSGLPILPGMRLTSSDNFTIFDTTHNKNIALPANSVYIVKNLRSNSDKYRFTIPYPNGNYYARLQHLSSGKNYRTGVTLISPQLGSDSTPPAVSLSETIRVPVYSKETLQFSEIISEMSAYTVEVDEDTSVDADGNGVFDDDFGEARRNVTISPQEMTLENFDTPWRREMMLKIRDEFGNTTLVPLTVEIFTPIPTIQTLSEKGMASGQLNALIDREPIDFFRIRSSEYPQRINLRESFTENGGKFASEEFFNNEQIVVQSENGRFDIRKSGIFANMPSGYQTRVIPASALSPMSINVYDSQANLVYQQFLSLPSSARVMNGKTASENGNLVITPSGKNQLVLAAYNDPQIPGGAYITNENHDAILVIARDGNIYTLDNSITLSISEKDGFILIEALRGSEKIADFHYKIDFFYTNK